MWLVMSVRLNFVDWTSTTNKSVVDSSLATETHAAITAHGLGRFVRALGAETRFGPDLVTAVADDEWQQIVPMDMTTDSRSIYNHIRKDAHHSGEKSSLVNVLLLRRMCSIRPGTGRARLYWVPTRHQLGDHMTKSGRSNNFPECLGCGKFHEMSASKVLLQQKQKSGAMLASGLKSGENSTSVNSQCCN